MTTDLDRPWQGCRIAAFDLETTGTDIQNDRIIEVGVVIFEEGEVVERWSQLVDPGVPLPAESTEVTGIQPEDLVGQPPLVDVLDDLFAQFENTVLLAYNHEFDVGVLMSELDRIGRSAQLPPCLDPFPFCWEHIRAKGLTRNAQLGTIAEYMEIPLDEAHRAVHDAEAAGRVMLELPNHALLPDKLGEILQVQRVLLQQVSERFNRFRRGRGGGRSMLSAGEVVIELGAAYVYGDEADPVRALFSRIPDVRDLS